MSVLQLVQARDWSLYRQMIAALGAAIGRGPVFLGGDNMALIAIGLLASCFSALRARVGK